MSIATQTILDFWFSNATHWFVANAAFDEEIRARFDQAAMDAATVGLDLRMSAASDWLALLILLDQFPRNLYRADARAWAQDGKAQRVALSGLDRGYGRELPPLQRVFAYLPLEHAEDMALQQRSVALFEALCADAPRHEREKFDEFLSYARQHRDVIERFGRFPHRNAALGRVNTVEEVAYLAQPGAGF